MTTSSKSPITLNSLPSDVWSRKFTDVFQFLNDNRNFSPSLQDSDITKIKEQRIDGPTLLESSRPGSTILKDAGIEGQGSVRGVLRLVEKLMKLKGISEEVDPGGECLRNGTLMTICSHSQPISSQCPLIITTSIYCL
jgi:hypothetical protein